MVPAAATKRARPMIIFLTGMSLRQGIGNRSRRGSRVRDAVGNADAAETAAGDEKAGMPREGGVDGGNPIQMTDFVLCIRTWPAIDASEQRGPADADERRERRDGCTHELV